MTFSRSTLRATLATMLLGGAAAAGDFYVDAVHGDDLNSGATSDDAWQTITHALATVGQPPIDEKHTIHVDFGVHDPALGEVFPLDVPTSIELIGKGPGLTFIDGGGVTEHLVNMVPGLTTPPMARVEGFTLRNGAESGVYLRSEGGSIEARLRDLRIEWVDGPGVKGLVVDGRIDAYLERVEVVHSGEGLSCWTSMHGEAGNFELEECTLADNGSDGIRLNASASGVDLELFRCRILRNGQSGIKADANTFGGISVHMVDSLVAGNGLDAITANGGDTAGLSFWLERCTLADNARYGLNAFLNTPLTLDGCILYGNQDDISDATLPEVTLAWCDVGDGDFAGLNGNFSADPMFRDAAAGDYRLSFGSPCCDSGTPANPTALDLAGVQRPIDGDLDADERTDVGAFELQTLSVGRAPRLGEVMALECWGAMGNTTQIWASRMPLVSPMASTYGEFDLDRRTVRPWGTTLVGPGPPGYFLWSVPGDPTLVGTTFSIQMLTDSAAAPMGRAWTNALSFQIEP